MPKPRRLPVDGQSIWVDISDSDLERIANGVNDAIGRQAAAVPDLTEIFKTNANLRRFVENHAAGAGVSTEQAIENIESSERLFEQALQSAGVSPQVVRATIPIFDEADAVRIFGDNIRLVRQMARDANITLSDEADQDIQRLVAGNLFSLSHPIGQWAAVQQDQPEGFRIQGIETDPLLYNILGNMESFLFTFPETPDSPSRFNATLNGMLDADKGITQKQFNDVLSGVDSPEVRAIQDGIQDNQGKIFAGALNPNNRRTNASLQAAVSGDVDSFTVEETARGLSTYSFATQAAAQEGISAAQGAVRNDADVQAAVDNPGKLFDQMAADAGLTPDEQNFASDAEETAYKQGFKRARNAFVRDARAIANDDDREAFGNDVIGAAILDQLVPGVNQSNLDRFAAEVTDEQDVRALQSLDSAEKATRRIISEAGFDPDTFSDERIDTLTRRGFTSGDLNTVRDEVVSGGSFFVTEGANAEFRGLTDAQRLEQVRGDLGLTPAINEAQQNAQDALVARTDREILNAIDRDPFTDTSRFGSQRFGQVEQPPVTPTRFRAQAPGEAGLDEPVVPSSRAEAFEERLGGFRGRQRQDLVGDIDASLVPGSESEALQFGADVPTVQEELTRSAERVTGPPGGLTTARFDDEGSFVGPGFARFSSTPGGSLEGLTGPQTKFASSSTGQAQRRRARRARLKALENEPVPETAEQRRRRLLSVSGSRIQGVLGRV